MPRLATHDYHSRCIYHITFAKSPEAPCFGTLCGSLPDVGIARSALGSIIENRIRSMPQIEPTLRVLQNCVMPDHVHLLLFVTSPTELHLGNIIGKLKVLIHQDWRAATGQDVAAFVDDFYDRILLPSNSLQVIFKYIRQNPFRLAVRRQFPDFFRRVNNLKIGDVTVQAYGNLQLLDNPFKELVVVHRADSPEKREQNRAQWLYTAANGGVLVSPFISKAEKAIRSEAETVCGRLIVITNKPFEPKYKPMGRDFENCEAGRLLIISVPGTGQELKRQTCLALNGIAETLIKKNQHYQL